MKKINTNNFNHETEEILFITIRCNWLVCNLPRSPIFVLHIMSSFPILKAPLRCLGLLIRSDFGVMQNRYCLLSSGFKQFTSPNTDLLVKKNVRNVSRKNFNFLELKNGKFDLKNSFYFCVSMLSFNWMTWKRGDGSRETFSRFIGDDVIFWIWVSRYTSLD